MDTVQPLDTVIKCFCISASKNMANINAYLQQLHLSKHARRFCTKVNSNLTTKPPTQGNADIIGPPDSISNLRPIIFAKSDRETELEKKYRETREATQEWNQQFWTKHNTSFSAERKQFKESLKKGGNNFVSADEMSVFYKQFLDKNWQTHLNYNIAWYKKNLHLLLLEFRVRLSKLKFK